MWASRASSQPGILGLDPRLGHGWAVRLPQNTRHASLVRVVAQGSEWQVRITLTRPLKL